MTTLRVTDATVLGAAILGGVGAGVFRTVEDATEAMVRLDERFDPVPENVATYAGLYDAYCKAYDGLAGQRGVHGAGGNAGVAGLNTPPRSVPD